jgi:hypothetical protein
MAGCVLQISVLSTWQVSLAKAVGGDTRVLPGVACGHGGILTPKGEVE